MTDLKQKQDKEMQEKQEEYDKLNKLSSHKEKNLKQDMDQLQNKHKQELTDLILQILKIRAMQDTQKRAG